MNVFLIKPSKESFTDLDYEKVTSACWHPRNDSQALLGFQNGSILLYDVVKGSELLVFERQRYQGVEAEM